MTTQATFEPFIGGQAEVQNPREGYLYRGHIKNITVTGTTLRIDYEWNAQADQIPPLNWKDSDRLTYSISLTFYDLVNIGPGQQGSDRLCLSSPLNGEILVLFPPDSGCGNFTGPV